MAQLHTTENHGEANEEDDEVFVFPASFAQQRLWFLDQFEPNSATYNIPTAIRMKGTLDRVRLKTSLQTIVNRHESLRTRFTSQGGEVLQVVEPELLIPIDEVSLEDNGALKEDALRQQITRYAALPFSLTQDALIRFALIRIGTEDHVLVICVHHIVSDGYSMALFFQELSSLYKQGDDAKLPELPLQYADYAIWQEEYVESGNLDSELDYWKTRLQGELAPCELPSDKPSAPGAPSEGNQVRFRINKELALNLAALGRSLGVTPFVLLMAAFKVLLFRYTRQSDILLASPIANRDREEIQSSIGFYTNTVVFRSDLSKAPSFRELVKRVNDSVMGALAHQELPFNKVVEVASPDRSQQNPLFQIMFAYQTSPESLLDLEGLTIEILPVHTQTSKFSALLELQEDSDGLLGLLEYDAARFSEELIERFKDHFQTLLSAIVQDPDACIETLEILSANEQRTITQQWNETEQPWDEPVNVPHLISAQCAKTPHKPAIECQGRTLSYSALGDRAQKIARRLVANGIAPGSLVAVCLERSEVLPAALLGVLKAGAAYLPIDPSFPKERVAFILEDAKASLLLTQSALLDALPKFQDATLLLDESAENEDPDDNGPIDVLVDAEDLAYVIYTSGSTGKPKGVQIPHGAMANFLLAMQKEPGLTADDRVLAITTVAFDISVLEIFLPLITGATTVVLTDDEMEGGLQFLESVNKARPTFMQATPATWRLLIDHEFQGGPQFTALCGGEPLPKDLADALEQRTGAAWNMYGPTETTVWSTCERIASGEGPILVGRPVANTEVQILDDRMQPVPIGVAGELCIGGRGLSHGYLGRPELTESRFVSNPFSQDPKAKLYRTGDLAKYHPDGKIEHLGRVDHQVKVRGFRIELGEIESVLTEHESIGERAVIVREDRPGDKRLVAYYVAQGASEPTATELRNHLRVRLPDYMIPQHFMALDALPKTPNGKIDRKALLKDHPVGAAAHNEYVAPKNEAERLIARVWGEALGIDRVSVTDRFFVLGGHSLLSMQVLSNIEKSTGVRISPQEMLFRNLGQTALLLGDYEPAESQREVPKAHAPEAPPQEKPRLSKLGKKLLQNVKKSVRSRLQRD